jgi:dUTP pyrophosphatase
LAIELPLNTVGLIFPRSSIAKTDLVLSNSVGVIDQDYRGEILFKFKPVNSGRIVYKAGDRVGQLVIMPLPQVEVVETEQLTMTDRGTGGFGSTGA